MTETYGDFILMTARKRGFNARQAIVADAQAVQRDLDRQDERGSEPPDQRSPRALAPTSDELARLQAALEDDSRC